MQCLLDFNLHCDLTNLFKKKIIQIKNLEKKFKKKKL